MQVLIERVSNWFKQKADPREVVRHALRAASQWNAESTGEVTLRSVSGENLEMSCRVLAVRSESFIISMPTIGSATQKLGTNELLNIMLPSDAHPNRFAECRVINRVRFTAGDGTRIHCYRLSLPEKLILSDRRSDARIDAVAQYSPDGSAVECELLQLGSTPTRGVLLDLSATGAKIRSRNAHGRVALDTRMYLKASLKAPVGSINEAVTIVRVERVGESDMTMIGVRFVAPLAALKKKSKKK